MSRKPAVVAAGGVVLRERDGEKQVLIIHRDKFDDWSLPKGKGKSDELEPETAVREIQEETGALARLDLRLPSVRYMVSRGPKVVHFWRASVREMRHWRPNHEVDEVRWVSVKKAMKQLSYSQERETLEAALAAPDSVALLLVRHGKAMLRKNWTGNDQKRRLAGRGRKQAKALVSLLDCYAVERTVSSSAERCMKTLKPYAAMTGLTLEGVDLLTEEEGTKNPKEVRDFLDELRQNLQVPTAICGHRPVLPSMFKGLGIEPRPMVVGEGIAYHFDRHGRLLATDVVKPTA